MASEDAQMQLFSVPAKVPLAEKMRPYSLDDVLGQVRILGKNSMLRRSISSGKIPSMIFWGPPGCGKTSMAHVIEFSTKSHFAKLSAVSAGVKDVKNTIASARERRKMGRASILFIDEIHRFNKSQQDALLGAVEDGTITLIGATTENPSFEINNALLSRCQLILFAPLNEEDLKQLFWSALRDHPRGLCRSDIEVQDEVIERLISQAEGDARFLLNQIEWIVDTLDSESEERSTPLHITLDTLEDLQYKKPLRYDKSYDEHYNLISALHKSVRGSDPDAALYWLHRMLQSGEDPRYLLRRLIRISMEDVGLADPQALQLATSCQSAYDFLGIPEGLLALDQLTVYLSLAPKSNSLEIAAMKVDEVIRQTGTLPVPKAFRPSSNQTARKMGYGQGYRYDHDSPQAYSGQDHLPRQLQGTCFYEPTEYGQEIQQKDRLQQLAQIRKEREQKNPKEGDS